MIATMRRVGTPLMALAVAVMLAGSAQAQQERRPGGGRGGFGGGGLRAMSEIALVSNEAVQKDLALAGEELKAVADLGKEYQEEVRAAMGNLRDASEEERREAFAKMAKLGEGYSEKLAKVLKPEQSERLGQITVQAAGINAVRIPRVEKALSLKDDQKKQIAEITEGANQKRMEAFRSAGQDREAAVAASQKITKETEEAVAKVLTDEQKKSLEELKGKPFDVSALRPQGGFGGGRRPGGNNN